MQQPRSVGEELTSARDMLMRAMNDLGIAEVVLQRAITAAKKISRPTDRYEALQS